MSRRSLLDKISGLEQLELVSTDGSELPPEATTFPSEEDLKLESLKIDEELHQVDLEENYNRDQINTVVKEDQLIKETTEEIKELVTGVESLFQSPDIDINALRCFYKSIDRRAEKLNLNFPVKVEGMESMTPASLYLATRDGMEGFMDSVKGAGKRFLEFVIMLFKYVYNYFTTASVKNKLLFKKIALVERHLEKVKAVPFIDLNFETTPYFATVWRQQTDLNNTYEFSKHIVAAFNTTGNLTVLVEEALKGVTSKLGLFPDLLINTWESIGNLWDKDGNRSYMGSDISVEKNKLGPMAYVLPNQKALSTPFDPTRDNPIVVCSKLCTDFKVKVARQVRKEKVISSMEGTNAYNYVKETIAGIKKLILENEEVITRTLRTVKSERDYLVSVAKHSSRTEDTKLKQETEDFINSYLTYMYTNAVNLRELITGVSEEYWKPVKIIMDKVK